MAISIVIIFVIEAAFALLLLKKSQILNSNTEIVVCTTLLILSLVLRWFMFYLKSGDYNTFLSVWVDYYRQNGGFLALKEHIGNYNIPYLYFLALFSYSSIPDLYLIKFLSVFFDILLAYSCCQLLSLFVNDSWKKITCFFAILYLPTVVLNGAFWGQCDSIYTSLIILSLYKAFDDKPIQAMIYAALSFSFKLQAVFLLPIFAAFWFKGKIKFKHFFVFPLTYLIIILPAVILGLPFSYAITLYFSQATSIGTGLNYNSGSIFSIIGQNVENVDLVSHYAVAVAMIATLSIIGIQFIFRNKLSNQKILISAVLFAIIIPFLLPHMHDRYFFIADTISIVLALVYPKLSAIPLFIQLSSLSTYYAYLNCRYIILPKQTGILNAIALVIILFVFIYWYFIPNTKNKLKIE